MTTGRTLTTVLIIIGVLCLILSFLGLTFLQVTVEEVDATVYNTSESFYLKGGVSYTLSIIGSSSPWGYGSGYLEIVSVSGTYSNNILITFSFDGTADLSIISIGTINLPVSGNYRLIFTPAETYLSYGRVFVAIQESIVRSVIGIDDFQLIVFGILIIIGGVILRSVIGKKPVQPPIDFVPEDDYKERFTSKWDDEIDSGFKAEEDLIFKPMKCPTCGSWTDSIYCKDCGTQVRE